MNDGLSEDLPSQPRTIKRGGGRVWIHPAATKGRYTTRRIWTSAVLLLILYGLPWLTIGGRPFMRLSFLDTSFIMFGQHILIYEFYHFVLLAVLLVLSLFLASALYGRIWCGYTCPQTVFVEQIFGRIETFFEGSAAARLAAEKKPLTLARFGRKVGKHITFVAVAASFAFSLVALFTGPDAILLDHNRAALIAVSILTALAWFDGAYWREQFCHIVCPYGRFQGIMQDAATRTVGYDAARGEPRLRSKDRTGAGDCIDCGLCVRVCPSGIDIRQGAHQLECIGCAKCIDACDGIMQNLNKPPGLIRYDAVSIFASKSNVRPPILRPRIVLYSSAWIILFVVGVFQFVNREPFYAKLLSARGAPPYVVVGGDIKNLFSIKISNQGQDADLFTLTVDSPTGSELKIGSPTQLGPLAPGKEAVFPVLLSAPAGAVGATVTLTVTANKTGQKKTLTRRLLGPN